MKENNRHIIIEGISKLPEHVAPVLIWDNIDTELFSIPNQSLPIHTPAEENWNAIMSGISKTPLFNKNLIRSLLVALFIIIAGSGVYYSYIGNKTNLFEEQSTTIENKILVNEIDIIDNIIKRETINNLSIPQIDDITVSKDNETFEEKNSGINNNISTPIYNSVTNRAIQSVNKTLERKDNITYSHQSKIQYLISDYKITATIRKSKIIGDSNSEPKTPNFNSQYCDFNRIDKSIIIGPGIEYQYFLNNSIPKNTSMLYWMGGDIRVRFIRERFSVETGIGISLSKDKAKYTYNYLTNELIDTYEYVDSVHFDPITGTTEYFTTTVDVYDSIPHEDVSYNNKQYTYFNIPLILSYDIIRTNEYSINLSLGAVYYSEIKLNSYQPTIYHENSRITSIGSNNVNRNKHFFNTMLGARFDWKPNRKITISVNPFLNYYINQIYINNKEAKNPISIGGRIGLYYKF